MVPSKRVSQGQYRYAAGYHVRNQAQWTGVFTHPVSKQKQRVAVFYGMKRNTTFVQQYFVASIIGLILTTCGRRSDSSRYTQIEDSAATQHIEIPDSLAIVPGNSVGIFRLGDSDSLVQQ